MLVPGFFLPSFVLYRLGRLRLHTTADDATLQTLDSPGILDVKWRRDAAAPAVAAVVDAAGDVVFHRLVERRLQVRKKKKKTPVYIETITVDRSMCNCVLNCIDCQSSE